MKRSSSIVLGVLLAAAAALQPSYAAPIFMPAGSTVWMKMESNSCPFADGNDCAGSNQAGINPPNGIPLSTFGGLPTSFPVTGYAEILPDRVRTFLSGRSGSFMWASFQDTYTVGGTVSGSFPITVDLHVTGTARSVAIGSGLHQFSFAGTEVEIGTFSPVGDAGGGVALPEQFRITPFSPSTRNSQVIQPSPPLRSAPFEFPIDVATSHSLTVSVGDMFDLAYGVNTSTNNAEIDLLNTGTISFDLPDGVFLTSSLARSLIPEPTGFALMAAALGLCGFWPLRRRTAGNRH
ncbi:MAG: hypothetical protein WD738_16645 [Pirellulales bacterium]